MTNFNTVPIEDLYESTLQSDLGSTDMVAKTVKIITGTLTGGRTTYMGINYDRPSKYELVEISAINGQDVTIVTRALPTKSGGTGTAQNHPAGSKVIITHNYKVFEDIATAIASKADGMPTLDGSGAVYIDAPARDLAVPSPQAGQIVQTAGVLQYFDGSDWQALDVGTPTPNASTTVAGKVEIATQSQLNAGTDAGETGALLSALPSNLAIVAQQNKYTYAGTTAGTSTAYTAAITPAPSAYAEGQIFQVKIHATSGANPTINFNGLGAINLVGQDNTAVPSGGLPINSIVEVMYNGTAFQVINTLPSKFPVTTVYSDTNTTFGGSTTRFDITNPNGTTFRYTWDGTGTDPTINPTNFPIGTKIYIVSNNFNANNEGIFTITGVDTNYFEITNASGVAENDVVLGSEGVFAYNSREIATWAKPSGLQYVEVEVVAGGGSGAKASSSSGPAGGGSGGYGRKRINAADLGATETVRIGYGGIAYDFNLISNITADGGESSFGTHITCNGGVGHDNNSLDEGGTGGTATGGTINLKGQPGQSRITDADVANQTGGTGGSNPLGTGGKGASANDVNGENGQGYGSGGGGAKQDSTPSAKGGDGAPGCIVITEYF